MSVAVIGSGRWGQNLVKTFGQLNALSAIVDSSQETLANISKRYPGVTTFADLGAALESDIPAVAIATPVATHFEVAKKALLAGKDVFVEKPLTLTAADAEELVGLARDQNKILMVGHLLLYQPAIEWIRDYLESGALGEIHSLHQQRLNLGKARRVENALWSLGVHDVAVLLYLVNAPLDDVSIAGQTILQESVEDDVYLHLHFTNGVRAHLHVSWLWPEKKRSLVIVGSKGMLEYDELEHRVIVHRKTINPSLENCDYGSEISFQGNEPPLEKELSHFLDCIRDRVSPRSGPRHAVDVIRVMEQATQLLKSND